MRRFAACLTLLTLGAAGPAHAYTALYSFGDSLSDVGNVYLATGGQQPSAPYFDGRFSNGPNWIDDLASDYGLSPVLPSLAGGTDYAYGGARSGANTAAPLSGSAASVPTLDQQVLQFTATHTPAPSAALYTVWSGANDLLAAVRAVAASPATPAAAAITQAVTDEVQAIQGLVADGARNLIVVDDPDIGLTPALLGTPLAELATSLTQAYDTSLRQQVGAIGGASIEFVDVFPLIANAASYGFTNTTTPCFVSPTGAYGDPNYQTDGSLCAQTRAGQDSHLFFDTLHPTEAGYAIVAALAVPEPASLGLLTIGLGAGLLLRRATRAGS